MPSHAVRLDNLPPYIFAVLGERLRKMEIEGIDVIRLDVGNPDMPPAPHVLDTLSRTAANPDNHGYSGYRGIPKFRQSVMRYYDRRFNVKLNPENQVLPLIGSKEGIINLCLAYLDRGDIALIPDIGYPSYMQGARLAGAEIYWMPVRPENGYLPDLDAIPTDIAQRAKILWVNYPNNPTGAAADLDFYRKAAAYCTDHNILLASDNPYVDVTFDDYKAPSALEAAANSDHLIEFMSFSKSYNMAGWRLGAVVGSAKALQTLLRVKSNMDSGHFTAVYEAGVAALDDTPQSWIDERNLIYQRRRDRLMQVLPEIGLSAEKPAGSLYIWASPTGMDAQTYVEQALTEAKVSLAPGAAYGPGGENYIRLSVGISDERFEESLTRLKVWYSAHQYA